MGSLNDLVICEANGHRVAPAEEDRANRELEELLGRVSEFAGRFT